MRYIISFLILLTSVSADSIESLTAKLGDKDFKVRKGAKEALFKLYDSNQEVLDRLYDLGYGKKEQDIEKRENAKELVKKIVDSKVFVERGCTGISLTDDLEITAVTGPAAKAEIKPGWILLNVNDIKCEGKGIDFTVAIIHARKPGDNIKFVFSKPDGKLETVNVKAAPRSKVRDDEDVEARKKEFWEKWLEKKTDSKK